MKAAWRLYAAMACALLVLIRGIQAGDASEQASIDPRDHRAAIREKLLKLTPLGEPLARVVPILDETFVAQDREFKVQTEVGTSANGQPVKTLRVDLGEYLTNPVTLTLAIPLPIVADTSAIWIFDSQDRLVDIVVSKKLVSDFDAK